jgi:predicted nuclease of predicted toxin-antitoxin system
MKFIVDAGVGKKVEEWLKNNQHDVLAVRDLDVRAKDADILRLAAARKAMVITMDKDFGELVYNSGLTHAGVLILRLEDATGDEKVEAVRKILIAYPEQIENRFCVFRNGRLRIRK